MTHKNLFLISLLFAFFGIQSINAQSGDSRQIIYEGYATGSWIESFWFGQLSSTLPTLDPTVTYGVLYTTSGDGGDDCFIDLGRNFAWTEDGINYIYDPPRSSPEDRDEGDKIRYFMNYDGYEILQTDNGPYFRCSCIYDTQIVSIKIYQ